MIRMDSCQLVSDPTLDCNGNSVLDAYELSEETDENQNGVLDACD